MGTVRDPDFWRRFSRAVHQDEALKYAEAQEQTEKRQRPGIKHSYVSPSKCRTAPPSTSPTSISPLEPVIATTNNNLEPLSPQLYTSSIIGDVKEPSTPMFSRPTTPRNPTNQSSLPPKTPSTTTLPLAEPHHSSPPRRPRPTHMSRSFTSHRNASNLTLGFSGRPPSRFKFWTQISSDPSNRDSWLESQRKKKRQRAWICWIFWLSLLGLIAAVVFVVLFLKRRGII